MINPTLNRVPLGSALSEISGGSVPCDPIDFPGLLCFWDFQGPPGQPRLARGGSLALREGAGTVERVSGGVFGEYCAELKYGNFLTIPHQECPQLNLSKLGGGLTVMAWIKRFRKPEVQCEAIAGMWNETRAQRQYGLFLDLRIHNASDNVAGHISAHGGPTPGYPWCMDAAIGSNYMTYYDWHCVAFSYDGQAVRVYLDGALDARPGFNPYAYPRGMAGGAEGADFTVGAVDRGGEMGNWFVGLIGGLAIYRRALNNTEVLRLSEGVLGPSRPPRTKPPMLPL